MLEQRIHQSKTLRSAYERIVGDDDARFCGEISDSACREVPGNFFITLAANFLTKLGDALIDAKTVLPWMLGVMGAPAVFIGLLVPIRESGSLLPQMFIAGWIRRLALRKWVWIAGSVVQGLCILAMLLIALRLHDLAGGLALIIALVAFSLARGFSSIAAKDVLGKTIPRKRRGRVTGLSASLAGVVTLVAGTLLMFDGSLGRQDPLLVLFLVGATAWFLAALIFCLVREQPGETDGGASLISGGLKKFRLLKTDIAFRDLCITRGLMLSSALSAPYYVAIAREQTDSLSLLGLLVVATGAAGLLSGYFWGALADRSSRQVLVISAGLTAVSGIAVFCLERFWISSPGWLYVLAFFFLAVVHNGVRLGRKTYVVDMARGNLRTDYVATGNTLIGILLLLSGSLSFLTFLFDAADMVLILALLAGTAMLFARRLPEVTDS